MEEKLAPFPPVVDLGSASWELYGKDANAAITERNNRIIARLAARKIQLGDHIYGFPLALRRKEGRSDV